MKPSEDSSASDPLLPTSAAAAVSDEIPISYVHSPRPLRDLPFLLLFLLLSLASFTLGFVSVARRNPHYAKISSFSFDPSSSSCALSDAPQNSRLSASLSEDFYEHLVLTLLVTAVLSAPIALAFLSLLRRFARQLVYISLPFFILTPSFLNLYWFLACSFSSSCSHSFPLPYRILVLIFVFLLIALFLWIIVANWHRIELTINIVRVAAAALEENLALVVVLPSMGVGLLVYLVPFVVFLVFARWNGKVVPRARGDGAYECVWREDKWVPAYFALAIVTMIWTAATMVEAQVYVISGTIAQWYFYTEEGKKPRRSIRSSMR